jgi:hypothetical protein
MKKTTTLKEKIALTWTFPLVLVTVVAFAILTAVLYFGLYLMNITGTTGAALYIFDKLRLKITDIRLRKLIRKDEKLYKFDSSKLKKDENTTSIAD